MTPSREISRLIEIMAALRNRESGCPWDVEQTFATIAPYTVEEAYEVADAIERNDMVDLVDELGDLLLQVVFHARIAEEVDEFSFGDVVEAITRKMIRRHPHVFGDVTVHGRKLAKGTWERIKAEEKADRAAQHALHVTSENNSVEGKLPSLLDDVPRALPALTRAIKLQKKAARVGFDWDTAPPILDKISEEIQEFSEAMETARQEDVVEEYGDLLFALVNLGRHLEIEPEAALDAANLKFSKRFRHIENRLRSAGRSPSDSSLDEMEALWQEAKTAIGPQLD